MLKISVNTESEVNVIKLEGKLSGPWVRELKRTWCDVMSWTAADSVVVDLSDVSFIDSEGEKLLGDMFHQGAELRNGNLVTRDIVNHIKQAENTIGGR